jgi:hypothetical protein
MPRASQLVVEDETRLEAIREALAECEARLARYRQALEAGADPTVVTAWIRGVQAERPSIEHDRSGTAWFLAKSCGQTLPGEVQVRTENDPKFH